MIQQHGSDPKHSLRTFKSWLCANRKVQGMSENFSTAVISCLQLLLQTFISVCLSETFHFRVCKWASHPCFCVVFIYLVYVTRTMPINQHQSFHFTVNVSQSTPLLPPSLLSLWCSPSLSSQSDSNQQICRSNSNDRNCLWDESVSNGRGQMINMLWQMSDATS